jgi:predicted transcriptional regulator
VVIDLSRIVTLRLDDTLYAKLKKLAAAENRPLSNYIVTVTKKYMEESIFAGDAEMDEVLSDKVLMARIKKGSRQVKAGKGRLIG